MSQINKNIVDVFGKKLRVRVNGVCIEKDKILLVKHKHLGNSGFFWSPPGGGMEFGSSVEENLQREFLEETGLIVKVENLLFVHEYLNVPLHAIELFFSVLRVGGKFEKGYDPEIPIHQQIISDIKWMNFDEIRQINQGSIHQIFKKCESLSDLFKFNGYFRL